MFDISYECELKICISGKILDGVIDGLDVDFFDFVWALDNYDFFSILYKTHGGI